MIKRFLLCACLLITTSVIAADSSVYVAESMRAVNDVYQSVHASLEKNGFYVVFEADIGKNIAGMASRWGDDYNRNRLGAIRSMVFCNGWYANQVSNVDPHMLALCPLHLTIIEQAGMTKVLFVRPEHVARGTAAEKVAAELAQNVIKAIEAGIK